MKHGTIIIDAQSVKALSYYNAMVVSDVTGWTFINEAFASTGERWSFMVDANGNLIKEGAYMVGVTTIGELEERGLI